MTHPSTEHSDAEYGQPPEYPTSQMVPPEFWRKEPDGDPDNKQIYTVEYPDGPRQREVEPGWTKPVNFTTDLNDDGEEDEDA